MKLKKTKLILGMLACVFSITFTSAIPMVAYAADSNSDVELCSDILQWLYKEENGKLYKRLYNATKGYWEGDWIYVCDVE